MNTILKKVLHYLALTTAIAVVLFAILVAVTHVLIARLNQDVNFYQKIATKFIGHPVRIEQIHIGWRVAKPVFVFDGIQLLDRNDQHPIVAVRQIKIGVDLISSLIYQRFVPSSITLSGTKLSIDMDANGKIDINDIQLALDSLENMKEGSSSNSVFDYIALPERINVQDVELLWHDASGRKIPLQNINIKLKRIGSVLHVVAKAELKQKIPTRLELIVNLSGAHVNINDIDANIYVNAKNLVLQQWLPQTAQVSSGIFNGKLWIQWRRGQFQVLQSHLTLHDLEINSSLLNERKLIIEQIAGDFLWQHSEEGWTLTGNKIHLLLDNKRWPENEFRYTKVNPSSEQKGSQTLQVALIPIENVSEVIQKTSLLKTWQPLLTQLQPAGQLMQAYFTIDVQENFTLQTQFKDLTVQPAKNWPGITRASGFISTTAIEGQIALNTEDANILLPKVFAVPLDMQKILGSIQWSHTEEGWQITCNELKLQNPIMDVDATFNILIPSAGGPVVHALAGFNLQDAQTLMNYVPARVMKPEPVAWLQQGFLHDGEISGSLLLDGNLNDLPFDKNQGQFLITAQVKNISLHYAKDWPIITNINADLSFEGPAMYITASQGEIMDMQVQEGKTDIYDLRHPELEIYGLINGQLSQGLAFVQASPLVQTLGKELPKMEGQGPVSVSMHMQIPLHKDQIEVHVQGDLSLQNNNAYLSEWHLPIHNLNGHIQFTEDTVTASQLGAVLFNRPINIDVKTTIPSVNTRVVEITTGSTISVDDLQKYLNINLSPYVQGATNYNIFLQVKHKGTQENRVFTISSDLAGISLDLPVPLKKEANAKIPFSIDISEQNLKQRIMQFVVKYDKYFDATIAYQLPQTAAKNASLTITGYLSQFTWDVWKEWYDRFSATPSAGTATKASIHKLINRISFTFGSLNAFEQQLTNATVELSTIPQAWSLAIHSNPMEGEIIYPFEGGRKLVRANFERLYLSPAKNEANKPLNPAQMPALDFSSDDFGYAGKRYGALNLRLSTLSNGVAIDQLKITSPIMKLSASGEWVTKIKQQWTHIEGSISSSNWGSLLKNLEMTSNMEGGQGKIAFNLAWPAPPYAGKIAMMNGGISIDLANGNIVNLSSQTEAEIGLGRILNLFSLQSISRRLTLDFSDLTQKGFSYDTLRGNFTLQNGVVSTKNASLEGSVAQIVLNGRIGMVQRNYDLFLIVTPHLTSSLPVIATVAGGPVVGAIAWVADKIISVPVNKITSTTYKVTGSWDNPSVIKSSQSNNLDVEAR